MTAQEKDGAAGAQADGAGRRTELAADRTILAEERTYAAWMRTGLAALAAGIGARALLDEILPAWLIGVTGSVLILFGGFCFIAAVWRQMTRIEPRPDTRRIPPAVLIPVNGFLLLVSLAAIVGIWLS